MVDANKRCNNCGKLRSEDEFESYRRKRILKDGTEHWYGGLRSTCKDCTGEVRKRWRRKNPDRSRASCRRHYQKYTEEQLLRSRRYQVRKDYGITWEEYLELLDHQSGACAVCGVVPSRINVDHCHTTGKVRGLLCTGCNVALGCCKDDPNVLDKLASYLRRHEALLKENQ